MDQFLPKFFKEASFRRLAATTIPVTMSVHNYTGYGDETEQVAVRRSDVILNDTRNSITMSWPISSDGTRNTASLDFYDVQAIIDTGVYTAEPDTRDYPLIKLTFSPPSRKLVQDFLNNISRPQPKIIKSRVNVNGLTLDCTIELDPSEDNTVTGSITAGDHLYMALSATELMQLASGSTITRNGRKISLPSKLAGDLGVQIDMLVEQMHNRQARTFISRLWPYPVEQLTIPEFIMPSGTLLYFGTTGKYDNVIRAQPMSFTTQREHAEYYAHHGAGSVESARTLKPLRLVSVPSVYDKEDMDNAGYWLSELTGDNSFKWIGHEQPNVARWNKIADLGFDGVYIACVSSNGDEIILFDPPSSVNVNIINIPFEKASAKIL